MDWRRWQARALRAVGAVEILAFAAVVMPRPWMGAAHEWLGLSAIPESPVFDSVMRQVSFSYGLHGVAMWVLAVDVARYRPLVVLAGVGHLFAAPVFFAVDRLNRMPWPWTAANGGSCALIGLVLLGLLWGEARGNEGRREGETWGRSRGGRS